MICPACGHVIKNGTVHYCPPEQMSKAVALQVVIDAADCWAQELTTYIAKASEDYNDPESAQAQRENAADIHDAIAVLRKEDHA